MGGRRLRHGDRPAAGRREDPRRRRAGALFEECIDDAGGQLRNGDMADDPVAMTALPATPERILRALGKVD